MKYWLLKQEPEEYSWAMFVRDDGTAWTGVRNPQACNYLRAMRRGDRALFYQSGADKMIVGIAKVTGAAYPDPTSVEGNWWSVDLAPVRSFERPVTLGKIKGDPLLQEMPLIKQTRLSVMPLTLTEYHHIASLGETRP
jgi:predicted RNA-binding protein with PUA-like domain